MAERRMMAKSVIDTDKFMDMPLSSQCLYFHLLLRADDDGFIASPKRIMRGIGCNQDDMNLLIAKRYLLVFNTGVIVIKHWRVHNYIRKDRYKKSTLKEAELLESGADNSYQIIEFSNNDELSSKDDNEVVPDVVVVPEKTGVNYSKEFEEFWKKYPRKKEKARAYSCYKARKKEGWSAATLLAAAVAYADEVKRNGVESNFIKHPATFLSAKIPFVDYVRRNNDIETQDEVILPDYYDINGEK